MRELYIYADFDWLEEPELVGRLTYERLRGNGTYGFCFDKIWLKNHSDIILSEDISNFFGFQYSKEEHVFGFISDTLPDRWGTRLLNRKEQVEAKEQGRNAHTLYSYDYLRGVDDFTRMGALRFKETENGDYINLHTQLSIPPLTSVRELARISQEYEEADEKNELPEIKWIRQLEHPGTSLGGARPKANVTDEANNLWIAKFPSRNDDYDVALWEHFCHILARNAFINSAETQLLATDNGYHALLSKRFDRTNTNKRIHFASAMSMTGLNDGDNYETGYGYLDIVDFIIKNCIDVDDNLEELYRRVAFNICVGNSDDHFRNHGFLLTKKGWTLAPAYDINPTNNEYQSLLVDVNSNEASLERLQDACDDYYITKAKASRIIDLIKIAVKDWRKVANTLQIPESEQSRFAIRFDSKI